MAQRTQHERKDVLMAEIKNLIVEARKKEAMRCDTIKCAEAIAFYIAPTSFPNDINLNRPFVDGKKFVIEAVNGRWEFNLDDITYLEFDIATEKRFIHVVSRAEVKDAEIQ